MNKPIVSVQWLNENKHRKDIIILDASASPSDISIPNARRFNIKENFSNTESQFPNTVPSENQFQEEAQKLGINQDSEIVVFDSKGIYTSPRVWWLFNIMGHKNISVLDGGLPEWINQGYETVNESDEERVYENGNFIANKNDDLIIYYNDLSANIKSNNFLVVDARSDGRFNGTAEEPRKNLQSGNIPGSMSLPYTEVLENGKFKSVEELRKVFEEKVTEEKQLVYSCGSGITACIIMLAGELAFQKGMYLYDGSWTEYAIKNDLVK